MQLLSEQMERELSYRVIELVEKTVSNLLQQDGPPEKRYLRPQEAMEYCGIRSYVTLDKWVTEEGLPKIRIAGTVLYDKEELDKFMIQYKE